MIFEIVAVFGEDIDSLVIAYLIFSGLLIAILNSQYSFAFAPLIWWLIVGIDATHCFRVIEKIRAAKYKANTATITASVVLIAVTNELIAITIFHVGLFLKGANDPHQPPRRDARTKKTSGYSRSGCMLLFGDFLPIMNLIFLESFILCTKRGLQESFFIFSDVFYNEFKYLAWFDTALAGLFYATW